MTMNRSRLNALKEGTVGFALIAGIIVCVVSLIAIWIFSAAGVFRGTYTREPITNKITDAGTLNLVPITFAIFFIGCMMVLGSLGYGLWKTRNEKVGPRETEDHVKVIARYAYDRQHNLLTEMWQIESVDRPRMYVRLQHQKHGLIEYECSMEVYMQAGEGMWGQAEYQGQWLGKFTPYVGDASGPPDDPYSRDRE